MAQKSFQQIGQFSGSGGEVPIFGCETISLANSTNWNFNALGPSSSASSIWNGDSIPIYNFSFTLFAGLAPLNTRADVHRAMRLMLSWAQHQATKNGGTSTSPPPPVTCSIPGYIHCLGTIVDVTCNARGPWEIGTPYPTFCDFSGQFAMIPDYDGAAPDIVKINETFTSDKIAGNMFVM